MTGESDMKDENNCTTVRVFGLSDSWLIMCIARTTINDYKHTTK